MKRSWILSALALITLAGCGDAPPPEGGGTRSILKALRGDTDPAFARVTGPRPLDLPKDHGPHPRHQTEWWYYTGNLAGPAGERFGFQLTFFRTAVAPRPTKRTSAFGATQTWMAHLCITDASAQRFLARERFAREAVELAGASASPFRVWTASWSATSPANALWPMTLRAHDGEDGLDLVLDTAKPLVLQGDRGYSRKGTDPGNASMYLSFTRLRARGHVTLEGRRVAVTGLAWMDHEWSTSALDDGLVGWDWFSLQLDDGRDVMVYGLRREDGSPGPFSAAAVIEADGRRTSIPRDGFSVTTLEEWASPATDVRYPSRWRITIPGADLDLDVQPLISNQELRLAVTYWEGAVVAKDAGGKIRGHGYTELVGYAEQAGRGE